jgi:hypothetical protein
MLFVRCEAGISHNPAESVEKEDVGVAIEVLRNLLSLVSRRVDTGTAAAGPVQERTQEMRENG